MIHHYDGPDVTTLHTHAHTRVYCSVSEGNIGSCQVGENLLANIIHKNTLRTLAKSTTVPSQVSMYVNSVTFSPLYIIDGNGIPHTKSLFCDDIYVYHS